ncbi:MAG: acyl-CoA/acyl-ACP dehydrogenase, partial [Pseudomonadales bacterium]|nr:acyl-CoA/acyl-ACP dehydrogenase [Pseudomonadales bacterium]
MAEYIEFPLTGLETPLNDVEQAVQENVHRFARDVMRPAGIRLDKLTPDEFIAEDSELWSVLEQAGELGLNLIELMQMEPLDRVRLLGLASEELAWGDAGLAGMILVNHFPVMYSMMANNMEMAEFCEGKRGCWAITEPDHGSDSLDPEFDLQAVNGEYGRPNCVARVEGDQVVISGQKSAWVSGGSTAEVCSLFCHAEVDGETRPGIAVIVPLDTPGVNRGKPLDKMGLRTLNQGEIFFEDVVVPRSHLLAGPDPDEYGTLSYHMLTEANPHVGLMFVGLARAAFEHALAYAHERVQGGVPIITPQNVR